MYKHWKMPLIYKYFTRSFQHGRYSKKIRKKASLPVVFHRHSLVLSMCPLWSNYRYTLQSDCQTVALFCQPAAQEFWERWHCSCGQNTSVATTVLIERFLFQRLSWGVTCPSFILSNKLSWRLMHIAWIFPRTKKTGHVKDHGLWICHTT